MSFVSYSQNFEDVMLWRVLGQIQNGRYIDVGAQDPNNDSVSLAFYLKGWRGVHIEPTKQYSIKLREERPDETIFQVAIGSQVGTTEFYEIEDTGLSTSDARIASDHQAKGWPIRKTTVPTLTLDNIFDTENGREIHWLKIDVEGAEKDVLSGWKTSEIRPWIILIEATRPLSDELSFSGWEQLIIEKGYSFSYFDGLNRFYVSDAHPELLSKFNAPPNVFDQFTLSPGHHLCEESRKITQAALAKIQEQENLVSNYAQESIELRISLQKSESLVSKAEEQRNSSMTLLEAKNLEARNLRRAVQEIHLSSSWKLTAPLRWISLQAKLLREHGVFERFKSLYKKFRLRSADNSLPEGGAGNVTSKICHDIYNPMEASMSQRVRECYRELKRELKNSTRDIP